MGTARLTHALDLLEEEVPLFTDICSFLFDNLVNPMFNGMEISLMKASGPARSGTFVDRVSTTNGLMLEAPVDDQSGADDDVEMGGQVG